MDACIYIPNGKGEIINRPGNRRITTTSNDLDLVLFTGDTI